VFTEGGTRIEDVLDMRKIDPMYRLVFKDKQINPSSNPEQMKNEIARVFPGRENRYDAFYRREQTRFRYLFPCLQKSYHQLRTMLSPSLFKAIPHLALGKSLYDVMYDVFGDEDLALSFTFQAKYLGMSPWDCPGLFSIIPYIEHAFGIYHPIGGLSRISDAMADIARNNGAEIHLDAPVKRILVKNGAAQGVELAGGDVIEADDVIINADFAHAATRLFEPGVLRKYTPARINRMHFSCSTYMMYLGLDKSWDMPHHAIFFAENYRRNVEDVFHGGGLSDNISFYIRNATVTDPDLAPKGHSAAYILVPVPNLKSGIDWEKQSDQFREIVLRNIETRSEMKDIRQHIREEHVITPANWQDAYHVFNGATFNLTHNLGQMIYLRPRNKFEDLEHCYLVGGGTHPGSGLPTIYESGRIAANLISRACGTTFVSGNLEV
jgi:phytoene desaturase